MTNPILTIDIGSSSIRACLVNSEGIIIESLRQAVLPQTPEEGIIEYDAAEIASTSIALAEALCSKSAVSAIGITDQRGSTVIWDRETGIPYEKMISWQDLRTVVTCLELQSEGLRLLPNQPATKLQYLLNQIDDPTKYCFGTPETWLVWNLTQGALHITDASHAAITGLMKLDGTDWDPNYLSILDIPEIVLPEIVNSIGVYGNATALTGAPPIAALIGDQQASLVGQGCLEKGQAKLTFGTSAMLDVNTIQRPEFDERGEKGTFPIIAWRQNGKNIWGIEAVMLAAGASLNWACDILNLADSPEQTEELVAPDSGGVQFVPALTGLGAPYWDFGARGIFIGLHIGITQGQMLRAVLDGIANNAADLIEAAENDSSELTCLRIDGGMTQNKVFTQAFANAANREIEVAQEAECTSLGAAYLAGTAVGIWEKLEDTIELYVPKYTLEPEDTTIRDNWKETVEMARGFDPGLSAIEF